eukprot:gene11582-13517_t
MAPISTSSSNVNIIQNGTEEVPVKRKRGRPPKNKEPMPPGAELPPITPKTLCRNSNTIVSSLSQNPNQPVEFARTSSMNSSGPLTEDAVLAYSWRRYIDNSSEPEWLSAFPQTKAVVRAMDAIQSHVRDHSRMMRVKNFVVSGASKRGWASWLAAAVDPRVKAVIPIVMSILNLQLNSVNHFRSYGGWSFAYTDFYKQGIMAHLNGEGFDRVAQQIDPIFYIDQLLMPKYIITAVGDQYFLPDSSVFFFNQLLGTKHQRIHPNTDHMLVERFADMLSEMTVYYNMIVNDQRTPVFEWSVKSNALTNETSIVVHTETNPSQVLVWTADSISTEKRDWRHATCFMDQACRNNITWVETTVPLGSTNRKTGNTYKVTIKPPAKGWRGAFV